MAIKSTKTPDGKLLLEVDNGDLQKLNDCMNKWSFKDHQSLMRFMSSVLILTEDKTIQIKADGRQQPIAPSRDLLKD